MIENGEKPHQITGSREDAQSALAEVERWLEPIPMKEVAAELRELYIRTKRKAEESEDRQAIGRLYTRELSKFPRDVALYVIRGYRGTFFPALDELRQPMERDRRTHERRMIAAALRDFIKNGPPPEKQRITREQADAIKAKHATEAA